MIANQFRPAEPLRAPGYIYTTFTHLNELLSNPNDAGNDPELDPNREPEPPTKVVDKPAPRVGKRNGTTEAPVKDAAPARAGRKEALSGNEQGVSRIHLHLGWPPSLSHNPDHPYRTTFIVPLADPSIRSYPR